MTKRTEARVARMIEQARIAGWEVTREVEDGMEYVSFDGGFYTDRFMVGSQVKPGGRTFVVRVTGGTVNTEVTLRQVELRLAYAAAAATAEAAA